MAKSTTCVVHISEMDNLCGEPVAGEVAGFPMCARHVEMFTVSLNQAFGEDDR